MAELRPYPFAALLKRMFDELESEDSIFDLPVRKMFLGDADHDLSVTFHGRPAATPFGPAAGPQTQMAQNIVLSWLAGGRILELKTVQIMDELEIPRPCIDMETIGFNVEWSQELKLQESLEEYVKGSMLIEILQASGKLSMAEDFRPLIFDMSVGYDLKGIQSEPVQAFMRGMMDASELVERFRGEIPDGFSQYRDLDFNAKLSDTLTLSTFHGCPPEEIESIIDFLLREMHLNCIVKLNPMLLGPERARELLNDVMGYEEIHIPQTAFENDAKWDQAIGFVTRLRETADGLGLGMGVKLTNTLIVENHREMFDASEKEMYLSGPPLHVMAMNLVREFRRAFGGDLPISFSAGIDRGNFADSVAVGLTPITVCSDLLKPGGYGRASGYFKKLLTQMKKVGAKDIDTFVLKAYGHGEAALDEVAGLPEAVAGNCRAALESKSDLREAAGEYFTAWVEAAKVVNTEDYVERATQDPRYSKAKNSKPPKKVDSTLVLFDCLTCDKCIPVCPNDANFRFAFPKVEFPITMLTEGTSGLEANVKGAVTIEQKHQLANFADFCNECGNCDIFCPEYGGPYKLKPRFFGSEADWRELSHLDGFFIEPVDGGHRVLGRFDGADYTVRLVGERAQFSGPGFELEFSADDPTGTASGRVAGEADLTYFLIMKALTSEMLEPSFANYITPLLAV